jgi:hypothetical protein
MTYVDGTAVKLGDRVRLENGEQGTVVFSIDTNEFADGFTSVDWEYLKSGVMVKTDAGALVHYSATNAHEISRL